jgi:prolyl-tRNA synthetase
LPINLYQIQTKFRDEFRPRFGVLRSREFQMKDAYSFHLTLEGGGGLDETYQAMYDAYCRIFERCGLPYVVVEAESGPIGGSASHEFMVPSPTGEDIILSSDKGNYAANVEKCQIGARPIPIAFAPFSRDPERSASTESDEDKPAPTGELEKVHTPGCTTIDDVCKFMKVKPKHMLKTLAFYASTFTDEQLGKADVKGRESGTLQATHGDEFWFLVVVRGDHEVNEAKLRTQVKTDFPNLGDLRLVDAQDANRWKIPIGFVGPHRAVTMPRPNGIYVDSDAATDQFWATGANEVDHHVKHFNWMRDVIKPLCSQSNRRIIVADIRNAVAGDPSPKSDGGVLVESRGIEIGHVFKLGGKYTEALDITVLDEHQKSIHPIMGCYGIGVNRILASAIEREGGHDDHGLIWPVALAPYEVVITPIRYAAGSEVAAVADRIHEQLAQRGIDVLLDDRDERPGVKFKDADLIGIPLRIVIGDKGLASGEIEFKPRTADRPEMVKLDDVIDRTVAWVQEQR